MALLKRSASSIGSKKDADEKIKEKRAKIETIMKGSSEPVINPLDYKTTLIQALNWYNVYTSPADKKKWVLDAITDKTRRSLLSKLDDNSLRQIGILLRLKSRNQYLDKRELTFIDRTLEGLEVLPNKPTPVGDTPTKPKNVVSIQDKIKNIASTFASEIDGEVDEYISLGYPKSFTFKNSVKSISGQAAKLIPDMYKDQIQELEEALGGNCEQLNDSYSHIKTVQMKNFLKLLKDFVSSCSQQVVSAKKVRVVRPKAPSVVVSKLKYLPSFPELELKSIHPVKLIGSQEAWFYDAVRRKLFYYKAAIGDTLGVNGTTVTGYDVKLTKVKVIRKPELIKELIMLNKKQILERFNKISCKEGNPNGRINEHMIILRTF